MPLALALCWLLVDGAGAIGALSIGGHSLEFKSSHSQLSTTPLHLALFSSASSSHGGSALLRSRKANRQVLAALLGPGTFISGLHAANKALICWCSDATLRDTVVKVADVGFLGLLGSLSLAAAWQPVSPLSVIQPLILETAYSHLVLEMMFNGIAIPAMCASEVDDRHAQEEVSKRQEIMQKAARSNVAQQRTGLRKDIWLHHFLAVTAFLIVLSTGEFKEEATMLTSVECTCALPVAFGQAAKAKQLKGARSVVLAGLMCAGFLLRVCLSAKLTVPRLLEAITTIVPFLRPDGRESEPLKTVSGKELEGSITAPHRLMLVGCSAGLTGLNVLWLCKIVGGIWKVVTRGRSPRKKDKTKEQGEAEQK
eukprot:Tamp_10372.p1 GENE.Tamp_10372~~Tamp_10372.p1  ORF type:complete len:401 (-),score=35.28 Tamp_10372:846-1949(-)